eukprot:5548004-Pyramimonas_sp.AAC.1
MAFIPKADEAFDPSRHWQRWSEFTTGFADPSRSSGRRPTTGLIGGRAQGAHATERCGSSRRDQSGLR